MVETKIRLTDIDPEMVIAGPDQGSRKRDAKTLDALTQKLTGSDPVMSGSVIFDYGS